MRPLFFLWIPKTGGSTLHNTFLRMYHRRHIGKSWTQNPGTRDLTFSDEDYIPGHWPFSAAAVMPNPVICTILRHPAQRVISHYNYIHEYGYHYEPEFTAWIRQATFREWLDSPYSWRAASNLQTRFLVDREDDDLEVALYNLERIDVIGVLEQGLQSIVDQVAPLTGVDAVTVEGHYRASTKTVTWATLAGNTQREILERNEKDAKLYRKALELIGAREHAR